MTTPRQLARRLPRDPVLHYALHDAGAAARACVLITHGYGEHSGRYHHVVEAWKERGLTVATYDLRGHGLSGGTRGHVSSFLDYLRDASELLDALGADAAWSRCGSPVVFGHSLGGLITFHLAAAHSKRFRGVLLSSPFFGLALQVPAAKRVAGNLFSALLPKLSLPTGLKGADVTRDVVVADAYDRDPLMGHNATARWFTEVQQAQRDARTLAADLRMPVYCLQGADDKVVSAAVSREILERVSSADRTFISVDGGYHEVLNDPGRDKLIAQLADQVLRWTPS